ncbi:ADR389Cp [Eremothecium gossypii ATCC 10895]|uniref:Endoplasmic reticulum-Golgi intermediate compartment protein n=1 Tax=Eremothecium gossypii (strain ATCC 10895 / CBS 109.51 / FGSC 9923 / NRRL Y-1056) TaxID=284811 RepID=Q758Y8_EREGS|nr:ADR389Cp [Eremothecium gossypii ATCC 10895]AAS52309.1 ADR389Cp [Eremothecium gossypii ATCC 10895]
MVKSKLLSLDAFAKTEEDVRVRTRAGGLITLGCVVVTLLLLVSEWRRLWEVEKRPQVVLDRDRQQKLELRLDITFSQMPCELLNLDIIDDTGEAQLNLLEEGFTKTRLDKHGRTLGKEEFRVGETLPSTDDQDYCGPCYGARDQDQNENLPRSERVCCQTCGEVRAAYAEMNWATFDGKGFEQCKREGYTERLQEQINEGCRVAGTAQLNRVHGNIHFAPGSAHVGKGHAHDDSFYKEHPHLSFNHVIHSLSFGPEIAGNPGPLNGRAMEVPNGHSHFFSYFAKVVPIRYETLAGTITESAEFSVTAHDRPVHGGRDADHPNTVHFRGGMAGMTINFEMSPLKVIQREQYASTWTAFVLNAITSIGGVLAVGTVLDRVTYHTQRTLMGKKTL